MVFDTVLSSIPIVDNSNAIMQGYDYSSILSTGQGELTLLNNGRPFNVFFTDSLTSMPIQRLHLGSVSRVSLHSEGTIPLGYDECCSIDDFDKVLCKDVNLTYVVQSQNGVNPPMYTITNVEYYPNNNSSKPSVHVYKKQSNDNCTACTDGDDDDVSDDESRSESLVGTKLLSGYNELCIKMNVPAKFVGPIRKYIILTCHSSTMSSESLRKELSVDAKPFFPSSSLRYFDFQAYTFTIPDDGMLNRIPINYIISRMRVEKQLRAIQPRRAFVRDYIAGYESNNFDSFCRQHMNVSEESDDPTTDAIRYLETMRKLVFCEEIQMDLDIRNYDIRYLTMKFTPNNASKAGIVTSFVVKGSSESRPKISIGDTVRFRPMNDFNLQDLYERYQMHFHSAFGFYDSIEFEGVVLSISLATEVVVVQFPYAYISHVETMCKFLSNISYHVRFTYDKLPCMYMQVAIDTLIKDSKASSGSLFKSLYVDSSKRLFKNTGTPLLPNTHRCSSNSTELNERQVQAIESVMSILDQNRRYISSTCDGDTNARYVSSGVNEVAPPYIVYGPPGTGKTLTVVHIISSIVFAYPSVRLLVAAPSDAAADVITKRLAKLYDNTVMLRLNYWKRTKESVPIELHRYCCMNDEGTLYSLPNKTLLATYTIVVSTCCNCGSITRDDRSGGNFDCVIIDEVSQAHEAETLIPLTLLKSVGGCAIVAGDTNQLSSIKRSPVHSRVQRYSSLQERLMQFNFYKDINPHSDILTSFQDYKNDISDRIVSAGVYLTNNYRSHQSIIEVSSRLFYDHSLVACGNKSIINSMLTWDKLPQPSTVTREDEEGFGCLFIGVDAVHEHDTDSPSFFNLLELEKIVEVLRDLLLSESTKHLKVTMADIGVIAAFRSQVLKLRKLLRAVGFGSINVGSVEDFQGQEMKIIVVSTVLSHKMPTFEVGGVIGLNGDAKRFNVCITRGMALTIVIGHPYLLAQDTVWLEYLKYCYDHNSYIGYVLPSLKRGSSAEDVISHQHAQVAALDQEYQMMSNSHSTIMQSYSGSNDFEWRIMI